MKTNNSKNEFSRPIKIKFINFYGLKTLYLKEISRFLKIPAQTIVGSVLSAFLFMFVFSVVVGERFQKTNAQEYIYFLTPGLIIMSALQNSFSNSSSSMISMKIQGNIIDLLMAPIGPFEIFVAMNFAAITRGIITGVFCYLVFYIFKSVSTPFSIFYTILFCLLGCFLMSLMGLIAGIVSKKYDSVATFSSFVIQPLTFLSGTFYSINLLPPPFDTIAGFNPIFMAIDGFRYGIIQKSDGIIFSSILILFLLNLILSILCYLMLIKGYKIKN